MGKFWVEICLISARGLTRTSSLWKLQWFAVGWIEPNNKYCTKVDASGNANPTWKTKFSALVDDSDSRFEDLALSIEVYSRDPVFLKERLQGTASVGLKEFLDKYKNSSEALKNVEEVGSFQLRKRNSNKPQGFVDVSIRTSQEMNEDSSYEGNDVGIKLRIRDHGVNLPPRTDHSENYLQPNYPTPLPPGPSYHQPQTAPPPNYALTGGSNHQPSHNPLGPSYHQLPTQPPPPYNFSYMPSSSINNLPPSYINMPPLSGPRPGPGARPGFAMGLGAGALAAGAAIFGDDFISGFDLPTGFTVSTDPPF
ncbi:hypothetical protein L1987_15611 [Smallanthus sonchifolius]|uniref:Uncharacterized protein n=1 Tax=Smallanthus sonchifolius TaxID=185202 RepID=A0ACB9J726_9ASTR|nr:hypothetical protein L1987_15611 [Smallanthus sonchifolius]